jgi:hypothetical protein
MKMKMIGIFLTMLLIVTFSPVLGINIEKTNFNVEYNTNLILNPTDSNLYDIFEIYEGQYLKITLTVSWSPPNPTMTICLRADNGTTPAGSNLTPPCNCSPGSVTSIFEWTPSIGQAGTYIVTFYIGENCSTPMGTFPITIIVHSSGSDNPPAVFIQSPADGSSFTNPIITVTGYAIDDYGLTSYGKKHEWTGDQTINSGTLPSPYPTYYDFSEVFTLHEGWNRITIFVSDTSAQSGQDQIEVYYTTNHPPNKPDTPSGAISGKTGISYAYSTSTLDPESDDVYYWFDWGDGSNSGWNGPHKSGDIINLSHTWSADGTYAVKVKAKDIHGEESVWSDPLEISMPKSLNQFNPWLLRLCQRFPILEFLI